MRFLVRAVLLCRRVRELLAGHHDARQPTEDVTIQIHPLGMLL